MNKILKIIFFICLFSYIFSIVITKIEPTIVTLGEKVEFNLTFEEYTSGYNNFQLGDDNDKKQIYFNCVNSNDNLLTCNANITLSNIYNLTKTLYVNEISSNLTVTIVLPSSLKILNFNDYKTFYNYGVSTFYFKVNYNELYNSSVSIKFGDISITNCEKSNNSIHNIICSHEFPESYGEKTLNLTINNENTDFSITIKNYPIFSQIEDISSQYYASSLKQNIYMRVDSSKNFEQHEVILVPQNSNNKNITLSSCTFDKQYGENFMEDGYCLILLDTFETYMLYVDNKTTNQIVNVFPERNIISLIENINPVYLNASSSDIIFTIEVDYVANLDNVFITLVDMYNNNNKINLTNCSQVKGTTNKITCIGNLNYAGDFYVYLNDIFQRPDHIKVEVINNSTIAKALYIYPYTIKFNSSSTIETIKINYDSIKGISSKNITLRGVNNTLILNYTNNDKNNYNRYVEYNVIFPVPDIYYVYIDDVYQNISVIVTNECFSKIFSVFPTFVRVDEPIDYSIIVDNNYGIKNITFRNIEDGSEEEPFCWPDKSNKTKVFCYIRIEKGNYYIIVNDIEFKNVTIKSKEIPEMEYYYPITIFTSSNPQLITLEFIEEITNYTHLVKFVEENSNKIIQPICNNITEEDLVCSATFKNEGKYLLSIDGYCYDHFFKVLKSDENNNIEDEYYIEEEEEEEEEEEKYYYSRVNNIFNIKSLLKLLFLFLFTIF